MLLICARGPFNMAKLHMKLRLPSVKHNANFCGRTVTSGRPMKNARPKNKPDIKSEMMNTLKRCW